MTLLIALVGLCIGNLLNVAIARQSAFEHHPPPAAREHLLDWVPILGPVRSRQWIALAVEVLTALMAVVLFSRYGLSARSLILFGASLVLIDTGAVDFKIRIIDTLILVVAMLAVLA